MFQLNVRGDKVVIFVSASPMAGEREWTVVVLCYRHMAILGFIGRTDDVRWRIQWSRTEYLEFLSAGNVGPTDVGITGLFTSECKNKLWNKSINSHERCSRCEATSIMGLMKFKLTLFNRIHKGLS